MKPISCRLVARHHEAHVDVEGDDSSGFAKGSPKEQLLRRRLGRIADLARRLVETARVNPQAPASGMVEQLVRLLAEAE